jgi:hypothetical protein
VIKVIFDKKLLSLALLIVFFSVNTNALAAKAGKGELQLSQSTVEAFIRYIKGNTSKSPHKFAISQNGLGYQYYYCHSGSTCAGGDSLILKECSNRSGGVECFIFASKRTIKWKNGINFGKGKASKISRKWSDQEIYAKLTELGFYNNSFSNKTDTDTEEVKKSTDKSNDDLINQIKDLKDLLDAGAITQDDFDKAKKKILN